MTFSTSSSYDTETNVDSTHPINFERHKITTTIYSRNTKTSAQKTHPFTCNDKVDQLKNLNHLVSLEKIAFSSL